MSIFRPMVIASWLSLIASVAILLLTMTIWVFHERTELTSIRSDYKMLREQNEHALLTLKELNIKTELVSSRLNEIRLRFDAAVREEQKRNWGLERGGAHE